MNSNSIVKKYKKYKEKALMGNLISVAFLFFIIIILYSFLETFW